MTSGQWSSTQKWEYLTTSTWGLFSYSGSIPSTCEGFLWNVRISQLHCSCIHEEAGRDTVPVPLLHNQRHASLVPVIPNYAHGESYPRTTESVSGLSVEGGGGARLSPSAFWTHRLQQLRTYMGSPGGSLLTLITPCWPQRSCSVNFCLS